MATRKASTPRKASTETTVDFHASIYAIEARIAESNALSKTALADMCKYAESGYPRDGSADDQSAFKDALALDVFALNVGLPFTTTEETHKAARDMLASVTLRDKPKKSDTNKDGSPRYATAEDLERALLVYRAWGVARSRKRHVFGAAGQKHWDKPLAKDDPSRETTKRGAKTPDAAPEFSAPDFKGNAALCGEWLAEITNMIFVTARKNGGIAALTEFHDRAEHNLIELFPVKEV